MLSRREQVAGETLVTDCRSIMLMSRRGHRVYSPNTDGTKNVRVALRKREYVLLGFLLNREPVIIAGLELSENGLYTFGLETTKPPSR